MRPMQYFHVLSSSIFLTSLQRENFGFHLDFGFVTSQASLSEPTKRLYSHPLAPFQGVCFGVVDTTILSMHYVQFIHATSSQLNSSMRKIIFPFHS